MTADRGDAAVCAGHPCRKGQGCSNPWCPSDRPDAAALTEQVAAVLAEHVRHSWAERPFTCACDPHTSNGTRPHRAHVAEAVAAALATTAAATPPTASHDETALGDDPGWGHLRKSAVMAPTAVVVEALCDYAEIHDRARILAARAAAAPDTGAGEGLRALTADARMLLAKYEGRSKWVGYEAPRREAWAEIEADLRHLLRAALAADTTSPDGAS